MNWFEKSIVLTLANVIGVITAFACLCVGVYIGSTNEVLNRKEDGEP